MTTKTFLTSIIAMGFIAPVMAAPTNTGSFPAGGLMQADYTYTNAANSTNMDGVYEGSVDAVAQYENILYTIAAGKYLPAGAEAVVDCNVPGSFCPGLQSQVQYDANNAQGLTSCSTVGDGSYTLSDGTGSANTSCYKSCTTSCTQPSAPAHSTNVSYGTETASGNQYYGSSCNAVAPTCSINFNCANGYHKRPDITMAQGLALYDQMLQMQGEDPTQIPQSYKEEQIQQIFDNWDSLPENDKAQIVSAIAMSQGGGNANILPPFVSLYNEIEEATNNRIQVSGYSYAKELNGTETCRIIDEVFNIMLDYNQTIDCSVAAQQNSALAQFRQSAQNGDWFFIIPSKNISMSGHSRCDSSYVYSVNNFGTPCQVALSMINGSSANATFYQDDLCIDPWFTTNAENDRCEDFCASRNAKFSIFMPMVVANYNNMNISLSAEGQALIAQFTALFSGDIDYMCDANKITINWGDTDDVDITANEAGTVTYGGNINTPVKAQTKPGKRFTGWRFSAPQQ